MKTLRTLMAMAGTLSLCFALTHCATAHTCYNGATPIACGSGTAPHHAGKMPRTAAADTVIYTPATIYRSWVNRHLSAQQTLIDAHDVYWVGVPGHWNVPIATPIGSGAALLGPAGAH